ncbi:FHA domain-containing protein [Myxococcota bacterium]|nr:FHA domain-containing protein [Myxococcota bacterium]
MATLVSLVDSALHPLPARLLVGRSPSCALRLDKRYVSGEHATLAWTGWAWEIRDLGSRNGTFVDGNRIEPGKPVPIGAGAKIAFGDPEELFELVDAEAPGACAIDLASGALRAGRDGLLVLPSDVAPELSIYQDAVGQWVAEAVEGEHSTVVDQSIVQAGGRSWRLQLPFVTEGTPIIDMRPTLDTVSLRFGVPKTEEGVELTIIHRGVEIPLEPREHGYVLLTLARARMDDQHLPPEQRGWRERDKLLKMLKMDSNALNVAIHRARQQLLAAGIDGGAGIVQVQRGARRLGTDRFQLVAI